MNKTKTETMNEDVLIDKFAVYMERAHKNATEKGFWNDKETYKGKKDQMLALMISEAAELLEAMRKPKEAPIYEDYETWTGNFEEWYCKCVKGSIHEELADICIRCFDYSEGYDFKPISITKHYLKEIQAIESIEIDPPSFVFYMMRDITEIKFNSFPSQYIGQTLAKCFKFADHYKIDLWKHIDFKMEYNIKTQ